MSLLILSIAALITLSQIPPPRFQTDRIQALLNQLAVEGQPPDPKQRERDAFYLLFETAMMTVQVAQHGAEAALTRSSSADRGSGSSVAGFDYRNAWAGWGAASADRNEALAAFVVLYGNGFADRLKDIAQSPRIARSLAQLVFLARGADEDEQAAISLVEAIVARMLVAAEEKRPAAVVEAADQALAIARGCALQPRASNWLLGANMTAYVLTHVRLLAAHDALDETAIRGLREVMDRRLPLPPISRPMNGRRIGSIGVLQDEFPTASKKHGPQSYLAYLLVRLTRGGFEENRDGINAHFDQMIAETAKPYRQLRQEKRTLESLECLPSASWSRFVEPSGLPRFALARDRLQVMIEGTRVALALHLHRKKRGALPATLAELVPVYLPTVPQDPFDPAHPLIYRRVEAGESASGRQGFLLYSVGADGTDDGGKDCSLKELNDPAAAEDGADLLVTMKTRSQMTQ